MSIFNRKTKKKHIEQFGLKIAELLESELPQIKTAIGLSKIYGISFIHDPKGIYISRGYQQKEFEIIGYFGSFCATHFGRLVPGISVQIVPLLLGANNRYRFVLCQ
jgi:hypothetical protein